MPCDPSSCAADRSNNVTRTDTGDPPPGTAATVIGRLPAATAAPDAGSITSATPDIGSCAAGNGVRNALIGDGSSLEPDGVTPGTDATCCGPGTASPAGTPGANAPAGSTPAPNDNTAAPATNPARPTRRPDTRDSSTTTPRNTPANRRPPLSERTVTGGQTTAQGGGLPFRPPATDRLAGSACPARSRSRSAPGRTSRRGHRWTRRCSGRSGRRPPGGGRAGRRGRSRSAG